MYWYIHIRTVALYFVSYLLNVLIFYFLILKQPNGLYLWHHVVSLDIGPILKGLYEGWSQQILLSSKVYLFLIRYLNTAFQNQLQFTIIYIIILFIKKLNIITLLLIL